MKMCDICGGNHGNFGAFDAGKPVVVCGECYHYLHFRDNAPRPTREQQDQETQATSGQTT